MTAEHGSHRDMSALIPCAAAYHGKGMPHALSWTNRALCEVFKLRIDSPDSGPCYSLLFRRETPCPDCPVARAMRSQKEESAEMDSEDGRSIMVKAIPVQQGDQPESTAVMEIFEDVTDRKKRDRELTEAKKFSDQIMHSCREGVILYDCALKYQAWNAYMEELTGITAEQVIGRKAFDKFPHLRLDGVDPILRRALKGDTVAASDIPYYVPTTGRGGWISANYSPCRNTDGTITGVLALVRDITPRKLMEESLRNNEARYRTIVELCNDGIVGSDTDGRVTFANKRMSEMLGLTVPELIGTKLRKYIAKADQEDYATALKGVTNGDKQTLDCRLQRPDGSLLWARISSTPVIGAKGGYFGCFCTVTDISDRKHSEEQARSNERTMRAMINAMDEPAMLLADDGRIILVNTAMATRLGQPPDELVGRIAYDLLPAELAESRRKRINQAIKSGKRVRFVDAKDDRKYINEIYPIRDPDGSVTRVAILAFDVSEAVESE